MSLITERENTTLFSLIAAFRKTFTTLFWNTQMHFSSIAKKIISSVKTSRSVIFNALHSVLKS